MLARLIDLHRADLEGRRAAIVARRFTGSDRREDAQVVRERRKHALRARFDHDA